MIKIFIVCSSGLGTSLMIRAYLQTVVQELELEADIQHKDVASVAIERADIVIGSYQIVDSLSTLPADTEVICLYDVASKAHLKKKFLDSKTVQHWLSSKKG